MDTVETDHRRAELQQQLGFPPSAGDDTDRRTRLTLVSLRVERLWGSPGQALRPFGFVGVGIGYAEIDDVSGAADGQTFNLNAKGGIETVPAGGIGIRYQRPRWAVDGGLKLERHRADWRLEDRATGRMAKLGDYTAWGAWLGLSVPP